MRTLLFIEDDPLMCRIYQNSFELEGFHVQVCPDGATAIAWLKRDVPDLVILDLMLLGVDGVELLRFIRGQPATKDVPVILLTNPYMGKLVEDAWKTGATACLIKAESTPRVLVEVVGEIFAASTLAAGNKAPERPPSSVGDADTAFLIRRREFFAEELPGKVRQIRARFQTVTRTNLETEQLAALSALYTVIRSVTGNAGFVGFRPLARFSSVLEAYLKVLLEKPKFLNASALRTMANAVDFLGVFSEKRGQLENDFGHLFRILILDDEIHSRRALESALEGVQLRPISLAESGVALAVLEENRFDLIFLDVHMPGKSGFAVCEEIRVLPNNRTTPVIFLTEQTDFESRAKLFLSGGNDLISKPFLSLELAVKVLTCLLKDRLGQGTRESRHTARITSAPAIKSGVDEAI